MNIAILLERIFSAPGKYPDHTFAKKKSVYTCLNPYSYLKARKHQDVYKNIDGIYVDGIFMCLCIRLLHWKRIPRLSFDMTTMAKDLFNRLEKSGESIFFVGTTQEKLIKSIDTIRQSFPNMNIAGSRNGYFASDEDKRCLIQELIRLNPDFVVVGMGTPLQDIFISDLKKAGYEGIAFTCGGFLHQTAEGLSYFPEWVDKYNLRGFYRQIKEKGIFKRNIDTFIFFPFVFLIDSIKTYSKKKSH